MKKATISYTKNNLSRVLHYVREGGSVVVVDRDVPVARIEPMARSDVDDGGALQRLERAGIVVGPRRSLDVRAFLGRPKPRLRRGASAEQALIEERRESR